MRPIWLTRDCSLHKLRRPVQRSNDSLGRRQVNAARFPAPGMALYRYSFARLPSKSFSTYIIRSLPNPARLSTGGPRGEFRNNVEVLELETQGDDLLAQAGEVVLVCFADLFD
jgi:hypothetical protein